MIREIQYLFEEQGGEFVSTPSFISEKLRRIKAYIFDWDGVFNNGAKTENVGSSYSEVDSMGTNLLRFGYWLNNHHNLPFVAIITGENNQTAIKLAERENFHHIYFSFKNKALAFEHFINTFGLKADQVAFVFDDVLDLPIAKVCGLAFMVGREGSPLLEKYTKQMQCCDYISGQSGENHAVREICELILGLLGQYEKAIKERIEFSEMYTNYLDQRKTITTKHLKYNP